jgi:hypothetical protein
VGRLNGTVSEVALKLVMEMDRWRISLVRKRGEGERVHDDDEFGLGKSVLVLLGLRRREYEEKVGMEAIEEREGDRERSFVRIVWVGWVGLDEFVVCTQHFLLLLE